ncbi:MAG: hypothetical protein Q4B17_13250 [Lautropia sp.]|nr:hypothetical protein [Lautropia sp.]
MPITVTTREFNQQASQMLEMSQREPVFITRWGKVVSVLSSYDAYQQQAGKTLAESFGSEHPSGELDSSVEEALEAELSAIRRQSSLKQCLGDRED